MKKYIRHILPYLIVGLFVGLPWLFPCWFPDKSDWIGGVAALGTLGALFFLIIDKKQKEKDEKEKFWHEHLPYLTIGSPCDPTQNRCEINLLENIDDIGDRGALLFSIVNFSTANAHSVLVQISTSQSFKHDYTRNHYIDFIPIYSPPTNYNLGNGLCFIYSKYHIDPETKEVRFDEFDLCNFTNNCEVKKGLKTIYIKLKYYSTPALPIQKEIESTFRINLECSETEGERSILINNIIRIEYNSSLT